MIHHGHNFRGEGLAGNRGMGEKRGGSAPGARHVDETFGTEMYVENEPHLV